MATATEILEKEITCGICRSSFSEPVTIECGHSFCKACLSLIWRHGATDFSCPKCRQVSQLREFPGVNRNLAQLTELSKELSCQLLQNAEGQRQCATHKIDLELFCEDDQTAVCVRCSQSPEHGAHVFSPAGEAAHRCREKLQHTLSQLKKHLEEVATLLDKEERPVVDWHWIMQGEYCRLHQFLMEEESQCEERIRQEQRARQDRICHYTRKLKTLMLDLQEAAHQPNVDLLQDVKQLLGRSDSLLSQRAKAVTPGLKEYPIPVVIEMLKQFRVDITMDPTSATSSVTVSEDLKSAKGGEDWQMEINHPKDCPCHYVFATQVFCSGRQYWEVDVSQLPQWSLGIYTPFLRRKRRRNVASCDSVFLLSCVKEEDDFYLQTYPESLKHQVRGPVPRVGVYLEYTPGTLAFYNVLQCSLIYRFQPIPFTSSVSPIFFPGPPLPGTKAGPMILCLVDSHLCARSYSSL